MAPAFRLLVHLAAALLVGVAAAAATTAEPGAQAAGCKVRITRKGLDLLKAETLKFVEEELSNIRMPEMSGNQGNFYYNITDVQMEEFDLSQAQLSFRPHGGLIFHVRNSSIALRLHRQLLYWFFYDAGNINASADGVHIDTAVELGRDAAGRLKIVNVTCGAKIEKMRAKFSGTLGRVYDILGKFLTTAMRLVLNRQICPALRHASLVHVNAMLETVPVRSEVDGYVGIDYSLTEHPRVTSQSLDMNFRGMFFPLSAERQAQVNSAAEPLMGEYDRMVYLALSEFFFDSGLFSYYKEGVFQMNITNDKMPKDLEMLLRTTYFATIMMMEPALMDSPVSLELAVNAAPKAVIKTSGATVLMTATVRVLMMPAGRPPVRLSSMTMVGAVRASYGGRGGRPSPPAFYRKPSSTPECSSEKNVWPYTPNCASRSRPQEAVWLRRTLMVGTRLSFFQVQNLLQPIGAGISGADSSPVAAQDGAADVGGSSHQQLDQARRSHSSS
ncbi:phospholipid transfer protein isoform X1 [Stigmatopora nigra]